MRRFVVQKVLVIKLRHHGDVLLTTALFNALRNAFPQAQIDALVYQETTPLLEGNPDLNRVLCIDRHRKGWQRLTAEWGLMREVRSTRYDVVIHMTDQWTGALLARVSGAPKRIQYFHAKRDNAFWHKSFTHVVHRPPRGQAHAVELNLLCLQHLGLSPDQIRGDMVLVPSAQRLAQAREKLDEAGIMGPFVLIHPAARWPFKCWEDERFASVVAHICNAGLAVVLTCSPDPVEKNMTSHIERLARHKITSHNAKLVNWGGEVSLPLVAALLKLCKFYVGVDSAPMHMAAALKVPQVALFGPSWVEEWKPWSNVATVVYAGDFGPLPHPDSINTDDTRRLLEAIPTQAVMEPVQRLIDSE